MHQRKQLPYNNTFLYDGSKINYQVQGKGKDIILVHGAFSHHAFGTVTELLSENFRVYSIHLPGFGASDDVPERRHNTDLFADVLDTFIVKLKLQHATVIAISLGSIVALKAAQKGHLQGDLVLVGVPGKVTGVIPKLVRHVPHKLLRKVSSTDFGKKKLLVPAMRQNLGIGSEDEVFELLSHTDIKSVADVDYVKEAGEDIPRLLPLVKNKKYFIYGENDPLRHTSEHLFSDYIVVPKARHDICTSNPGGFVKVVKKLL